MLDVKDPEVALPEAAEATRWTRKDLLDTDTLSREEIELILDTAEGMREVRSRPVAKVATLRGVTVVTLFYEQSTRTRASFEVAAKALGADVVNLTASGQRRKGRIAHRHGAHARSDRSGHRGDAPREVRRAVPGRPAHLGGSHQWRRRHARPPDAGAAGPVHDAPPRSAT
jgi:hypothetical protein